MPVTRKHILNFKGGKNTHISLNYFLKWFYQVPCSCCHVLKMNKCVENGHDCGLPKGLNCQVVHQPRQHEMEISGVTSQTDGSEEEYVGTEYIE